METIKWLKKLLNLIFILGIAALLIMPLVIASSSDIKIDGEYIKEWTFYSISKVIISSIIYILCLIGISKLREAITDFYLHQMFSDLISKCFKQIGYLIIIGTSIHILLNWIIESVQNEGIEFHLNLGYLIHLAIALFFFTLSIMIDKAKGIQKENDLTI